VEVEVMLGLKLEETRVYQEAKAEGRGEGREEERSLLAAKMLQEDIEPEVIARITGLLIEQVRQLSAIDPPDLAS